MLLGENKGWLVRKREGMLAWELAADLGGGLDIFETCVSD
jgi:hypothetical protein